MWVKPVIVSYPRAHLSLGIGGILEVLCAGVHIGQGNHCLCWITSIKQILNRAAKFFFFWDPAVIWNHVEIGHIVRKAHFEKRS